MATKGKRKRPKPKIANPLFCQWLQGWKDEAETKGWKSYHTYGMALSTLKKYPLRLDKGKDCKILMHFGDKICGMLDKKLQEHIDSGGSLDPAPDEEDDDGIPAPASRGGRAPSASTSAAAQKRAASDTAGASTIDTQDTAAPANKKRSSSGSRAYVPAYRSGPYAIITTLYQYTQLDGRGEYLTKNDLIRLAQPHCDKSLSTPDGGTYYTAFSSMATLITKGLVDKFSSPARYRLTNEGCMLAETLINQRPNPTLGAHMTMSPPPVTQPSSQSAGTEQQHSTSTQQQSQAKSARGRKPAASNKTCGIQDDIQNTASPSSSYQPSLPAHPTSSRGGRTQSISSTHNVSPAVTSRPLFTLNPDQYDILLIVDNREHFGFGNAKQQILPGFTKNGVRFDVRPLSVGDFCWIAKEKYGNRREVVLDYIVERKRLDDLSGSIVDGRYKEQKLRMKNSGLRKLIYLIEFHKTQDNEKIKEDTLLQAVMNTQIIDNFYVKRCANIKESIGYLTLLHNQILKLYINKTIHGYSQESLPELPFNPLDSELCHITYEEFNKSGIKTKPPSVSECWKRMLMCIPNVSLDKANCIVQHYPTIQSLIEAYKKCCSDSERKKLLNNYKTGATNRKIGDVLSCNICHLFFTSTGLT